LWLLASILRVIEGEEIHPRKWNNEFIDMPIVEEDKQNTSTLSSEVMTSLVSWNKKLVRLRILGEVATGVI
jgi:hypothetical protein